MKPTIGYTMGDFNGVGPEVVLKAITSPSVKNISIPLLVGSIDVFDYYARKLRLRIHFRETDSIPWRSPDESIAVFHLRKFQKPVITPGAATEESGAYAGEALEVAAGLCGQKAIDGMVTAPVSKEGLQRAGYPYPGQTEMLARFSGTEDFMMMLVAARLRVGLATIHLPLKQVARRIETGSLGTKLELMRSSLRRDFGIANPRIAVLGLNPHAGENGRLGDEEIRVIAPAMRRARSKHVAIDGPFPSDGFWGSRMDKKYDGILAMYHDQGLVPLKLLGFEIGVNYSAGLPLVRTSPDHGTAYDIAGKGIVKPSSMIEAVKLAVKIIKNRKLTKR